MVLGHIPLDTPLLLLVCSLEDLTMVIVHQSWVQQVIYTVVMPGPSIVVKLG
jgi:hypothetical protein